MFPIVNHRSLVAVKRNFYSVPVKHVGQTVEVQMFAEKIHFLKQGQCIAIHNRCYLQQQVFVELEHYLALLKMKPGALSGSIALKQAKQNGKWPAIYDTYWQALIKKHGKNIANKYVIEMLLWGQNFCMSDVDCAAPPRYCFERPCPKTASPRCAAPSFQASAALRPRMLLRASFPTRNGFTDSKLRNESYLGLCKLGLRLPTWPPCLHRMNVLEQAINSGCLQLENLKIIMRHKTTFKISRKY